jgi:DNA polymerase-3 subunit alpha
LEQGYGFVDSIAKLVPFKPGQLVTIEMAKKEEKQLAERERNEDEVRQLLALAQQLEGMTRNVGMHAGGVLIAPGKLTDFCPLYTQDSKDQDSSSVISQFDKDDVEAIGLVKFDFLGLTTLTILAAAERWIKALHADRKDWSIGDITLEDPAAFEVLKSANTVAVFQLESRGMQGMLRDAKPDRFEDIIALVALYRPGPMDLIPDFIARKHGRQQVEYPDPRIEPVLRETYGIMVYQEQVMQMAQMIGGYSLGGADLLRRAMGKKKPEEMAQHRKIFSEGAKKGGIMDLTNPMLLPTLYWPIKRHGSRPITLLNLWRVTYRWRWTIPIRSKSYTTIACKIACGYCRPISIPAPMNLLPCARKGPQ